jgi:6-phosphogluconate dehydrogenase
MREVGLIGIGTMGRNLALNLARHGYQVVLYDRDLQRVKDWVEQNPKVGFVEAMSLGDLVEHLSRPRVIWLMIPSGRPIDQLLRTLRELLQPGDVVIDGGNSHFLDTERRSRALAKWDIAYLGVGVSGGAEGALYGPSLMVGGDLSVYQSLAAMLQSIASRAQDGSPCVAYLGKGGAGHYVKMVHNGIEYALMQTIAEAYDLLSRLARFSPMELAEIFEGFQKSALRSYLMEITVDVLRRKDPITGKPLIEMVLDKAEQKGTGAWATQEALQRGLPLPAITQSVEARFLSTLKDQRIVAAQRLPGMTLRPVERQPLVEATRDALEACFLIAYVHGFALLSEGAQAHGYAFPLWEVARIWRGGCIIRSAILEDLYSILSTEQDQTNLLLTDWFRQRFSRILPGWREAVGLGVANGIPLAVMGAALAYYDGFRSERLPANLIQALRDCFGHHTFERIDCPGRFHVDWRESNEPSNSSENPKKAVLNG